jgi:hypothetical protein
MRLNHRGSPFHDPLCQVRCIGSGQFTRFAIERIASLHSVRNEGSKLGRWERHIGTVLFDNLSERFLASHGFSGRRGCPTKQPRP